MIPVMAQIHPPQLDLSQFNLIDASERLFEYICSLAKTLGQDPNIECSYITPTIGQQLGYGPYYRVMWESGSFDWGISLSNGGVTFTELDATFDKSRPAVVVGDPKDWYLEPYHSFDVGFIPHGCAYWDVGPVGDDDCTQILQVTGHAARDLLARLDRHPDLLREVDRRLFEELIAEMFSGFGYDVELTKRTRDGGKDIIAIKSVDSIHHRYLIECKRPNPGNKVSISTVKELLGTFSDDPATKALLVTTTEFTSDARRLIERHKWKLEGKDYCDVIQWASRYNQIKAKA
jgi:Restriction endonuclease